MNCYNWYEEPEEIPECKDIMCYFHGGEGMGCMTSGPCIYEEELCSVIEEI